MAMEPQDHHRHCPRHRGLPARAIREWLEAAGIESGAVFRPINKSGVVGTARLTDQSVALIVKSHAAQAGLDAKLFAGHSLRAAS